ncbi:MAG: hypothetical protein R6V58_13695 [Planctomycetota bacterium]
MSEPPGPLFERRPIRPDEREAVERLTAPVTAPEWYPVTLGYVLVAEACLIAVYLWRPKPPLLPGQTDPALPAFLVAGAVVALVILLASTRRFLARRAAAEELRARVEDDLADGLVEAAHVRAADVVQLDYPRGRKPTALFRIGERTAVPLYVLSVRSRNAVLPAAEFEYVRLPGSGECIGIKPRGPRLESVKHVRGPESGFDEEEHPECEPVEVDWEGLTANAVDAPPEKSPFFRRIRLRPRWLGGR